MKFFDNHLHLATCFSQLIYQKRKERSVVELIVHWRILKKIGANARPLPQRQ